MKLPIAFKTSLIVCFMLLSSVVWSQSRKKQELEDRRQALRSEIAQINKLLFENKGKQKSQLSLIEDLNYKINVQSNLIAVTNEQANLLTREINTNQKQITKLREELKSLKESYAEMIVHSYKSKSEQSRIMFLLSSSNFKQAYKRAQYIKQYADYQKQQGETIKLKTEELQQINQKLSDQKEEKQQLIVENKKVQNQLEGERKQHQSLMASIQKDLNKYASQIKEKQKEADKIDKEIERLIREAIANANKKAGKASSSTSAFTITAEAKALAANFVNNKGKLPWPVERGIVTLRFGKQPHPVVKTAIIQSSGVRIATNKGEQVRTVFQGEVLAVQALKRGNPTVLIQHGNYITAYKNLGKVYVKKGDKVNTKQPIGEVFTDPSDSKSELTFSVIQVSSKNQTEFQNPALWIYKM